MTRCFYFGCWNEPGHYLFGRGGSGVSYAAQEAIVYFTDAEGKRCHLDGSLAPRKLRWPRSEADGQLCWAAQGRVPGSHLEIRNNSNEYPQGHYLRHVLDNGFTAVQWWDRCQGDTRGACNSTILLAGEHTAEEMLEAGRRAFPHVFENLERGGPPGDNTDGSGRPLRNQGRVELVEIKPYRPPTVERIGSMKNLLGKTGPAPDNSQTHMTKP